MSEVVGASVAAFVRVIAIGEVVVALEEVGYVVGGSLSFG